MSAYRDFVIDLPERSIRLLKALEPSAKQMGMDVTLLLMVATTAFVIPRERLADSHPAGDSQRFPELSKTIEALSGTPFSQSPFFPEQADASPWLQGRVNVFGYGPDSWGNGAMLGDKPVSYVLGILRNAIAHGNLFTKGDPIKTLVFFADVYEGTGSERKLVGYKFLTVPVGGFRQFLLSWFKYVKETGSSEVLSLLAKAA